MTTDEIKDLCLVKLHAYRAQLDAAFAGNSAHTYPQDVSAIRESLRFWEQIATTVGRSELTDAQLLRIKDETTQRS